ncbi:SusC/RagA family TonB-linked outer membrane protein [Sphingobacterium sp. UT-1RO-CII-1]|uniref:SusC/RagA family TonB-linked outer membrane protein n=1 Tax=Sphingobacterium sp. UT-1RO-CII-1 TaxID=2995225 RepID=UPI00227C0525|nr:SusC/RagA family TonB-linked outer membrane protein [Sphingobacterium sp. UT-1RO-CII-1]MCY4778910.1 SusC/RagA family TonB-linked outer membrane protein [Sphingobacterium sp. UT-1RO-CII-1]
MMRFLRKGDCYALEKPIRKRYYLSLNSFQCLLLSLSTIYYQFSCYVQKSRARGTTGKGGRGTNQAGMKLSWSMVSVMCFNTLLIHCYYFTHTWRILRPYTKTASARVAGVFGLASRLGRTLVHICSTGVRLLFECCSSAVRVRVEAQSKASRRAPEGLSNKCRSRLEAQSKDCRRALEGLSNNSRSRVEELANRPLRFTCKEGKVENDLYMNRLILRWFESFCEGVRGKVGSMLIKNKRSSQNGLNEADGFLLDKERADDIKKPMTYGLQLIAIFCVLFSSLVYTQASAQTQTELVLRGEVRSAADGQPIEGASIIVDKKHARTDKEGKFTINVKKTTGVLTIKHIGYNEQKIAYENIATVLKINLKISEKQIEEVEVVSTGYQKIPKERATGSFSTPDKKMLESRIQTNLLDKLEGITSGLVFNAPGTRISGNNEIINIRGLSTIYANTQPLIVVDNFPFEGDINALNPNDVENVTILKDAAAASIWGVRAGNGVIVITTKKQGMSVKPVVSLHSNVTMFEKPDIYYSPDFMSSEGYLDMEDFLYNNDYYEKTLLNASAPVVSPYVAGRYQFETNNLSADGLADMIDRFQKIDVRKELLDHFYQNELRQQHYLSVKGGTERHSYYMSLGYDGQKSEKVKNSTDRITFSFNNRFKFGNNLNVETHVSLANSGKQNNHALDNTLSAFKGTIYPYASIREGESIVNGLSPLYVENIVDRGFQNWKFYPLEELNNNLQTRMENSTLLRINPEIAYRFSENLNLKVQYQYLGNFSQTEDLARAESFYSRNQINRFSVLGADDMVTGYNMPLGAQKTDSYSTSKSHQGRMQLNYNLSFGKSSINALAGMEIRGQSMRTKGFRFYGYNEETGVSSAVNHQKMFNTVPTGNSTITSGLSSGARWDRFRSYYINTGYSYNQRYIFSSSARIDQSNFFGVKSNQKSVPLWSVGAKWIISDEPFWKWQNQLTLFNARLTYGWNGNLDRSSTAVTTFLYAQATDMLTNLPYSWVSNYGNIGLRWEKVAMLNAGIDMEFSRKRFSISLDYFQKSEKDLMGDEYLPPSSGLTDVRGNYAAMKGHGIDIDLKALLINRKLKWSTSYLLSWATDRVTEYSAETQPSSVAGAGLQPSPVIGKPVYSIFSLRWHGLDPLNGDPVGVDSEGKASKAYSALVQPSSFNELSFAGAARPIWTGGWRNTFSYQRFDLSFNILFKMGYFVRRSSIDYGLLFSSARMHEDFEKRWQVPGDEVKTQIPSMVYPDNSSRNNFYTRSEVLVESGSHIRLQDINLSYNLSDSKNKNNILNNVRLNVYAANLGIIWRKSKQDFDPDFPRNGAPRTKSIAFGISFEL